MNEIKNCIEKNTTGGFQFGVKIGTYGNNENLPQRIIMKQETKENVPEKDYPFGTKSMAELKDYVDRNLQQLYKIMQNLQKHNELTDKTYFIENGLDAEFVDYLFDKTYLVKKHKDKPVYINWTRNKNNSKHPIISELDRKSVV